MTPIDFIDPNLAPDSLLQQRLNNLRGIPNPSPPPLFANNASNFHIPAQASSFNKNSRSNNQPPVNDLFGSQTAT